VAAIVILLLCYLWGLAPLFLLHIHPEMSATLPRTSPCLLPLKKHCTLWEIHLQEVKTVMYFYDTLNITHSSNAVILSCTRSWITSTKCLASISLNAKWPCN
jgi:hypothetical protein